MTVTYTLAPIPKWYIADLTGKPLGGGSMKTFKSLDKTTQKAVYQDPAGAFPWPNPNLFDENGSQGPFYWKIDSASPTDTYYVEVYDANGLLQWTIDQFDPPGSGGSTVTEGIDLENLITNNVMWRNKGSTPVSTAAFMKLAPGAHAGLAQTASNAGPDICFIKNNTSATDTISFPKFTLGSNALTGDVTPVDYLNYTCTGAGSSETTKCVQFPITKNVQNLSNQQVTFSIWARCNSGTTSLTLQFFQFFGDGAGASSPAITLIQILTLTNSWVKYQVTTTVPDVTAKTLGPCGNDSLFLRIQYPLSATCNTDLTKPCLYLGTIASDVDYHTYDMTESVMNSPRTGYVFKSYDLDAPFGYPNGYLIMDDTNIGDDSSGANHTGKDLFPLYNLLWNNVSNPSSNAWCTVSGGLGASAVADFTAHKTLNLPRAGGRAFAGAGLGIGLSSFALGQYFGEEKHTMTVNEIAAHSHAYFSTQINSSGGNVATTGSTQIDTGVANTTGATGATTPFNVIQPTSYINNYIKL